MEYLYPQMGKVTLQCSHCTLWTWSGHAIGLHMCSVYDFHNMLWIFSGLKCVGTVQIVRKFCALKKLALVPTIIMHNLRGIETSLISWASPACHYNINITVQKSYACPSEQLCLYSCFCFSFAKFGMLTANVSHLNHSKFLLQCLAHWDCLQTSVQKSSSFHFQLSVLNTILK